MEEETTEPTGITIGDFAKVELKVGRVKDVSEHPNADRLLVLKVDVGEEEDRQLVAGIRNHYSAETLVGKNIVVVANLQPAKLRGVESAGMILAARSGEEVIVLTTDKDAAPGSSVS